MPFNIFGANSVSGYTVKNSLRFNSGSSDTLTRTPASAGNRKTWTWSAWLKLSNISTTLQTIFSAGTYPPYTNDGWTDLQYRDFKFKFTGGNNNVFDTTALYRDPSAWYHLVLAVDTTQATDTNRVKFYINGSQVTSFSAITYPAQNDNYAFNNNVSHSIGNNNNAGAYFNGYLSDIYNIDGQQLTPSSFGETDTDTGIWKPKAYTGTYGTNGFYLKFANSASLGTDSSGNGNNFTVNNLTSIDQTTDTPTNNFATMNPLMIPTSNAGTFTEGNLSVQSASAGYFGGASTIGVSKGKWYWEGKITAQTADCGHIGIDGDPSATAYSNVLTGNNSWSYGYNAGGTKWNNGTGTSYGSTFTLNDILMIAMDLDNNYVYFGKNGTWQNSGVPTSGSSGTGSAFSISSSPPSGYYFIETGDGSSGNNATFQSNFGNPPYTANGYTDGAGFGNFSYAVPSGFYSLCTKNLAQFG